MATAARRRRPRVPTAPPPAKPVAAAPPDPVVSAPRARTSTSNFGVSVRESHDATPFYDRFRAPELTTDCTVHPPRPIAEPFVCGDARRMSTIADGSVALVVTSPPYFAGKVYEEELEREGVPASYLEYLQMLTDVFAECVRTLEPGGRIAVNVANLGRKPYRSLSADVIRILQHDLGLLLRGELLWQKGDGASGSCAWGSYRSAANPVLRDVTERVIVASKGRFDRALTAKQREAAGLPHRSTVSTDDFLALTLDTWSIPAESARRVGHPAPFPVELPEQLIRLYTFVDDLVLDPFMGSGSAMVAASRLGRRYVGYDLDPEYVALARRRVTDEGAPTDAPEAATPRAQAVASGKSAVTVAERALDDAGFTVVDRDRKVRRTGVTMPLVAVDGDGQEWWFDVPGAFTTYRGGLGRMEAVWKSLGRAAAVRSSRGAAPLVLLATEVPRRSSEGDQALRAAGADTVFDVVDLLAVESRERLAHYAKGGAALAPLPGFWLA